MSKKPSQSSKKDTISQQTKQKQQLKTMKKMDVSHLKQQIHQLRQQLKHLINQKIFVQKDMQKRSEHFVIFMLIIQQMNESYQLQKVNKTQQEEIIQLQSKLHILKNTFTEAEGKKKFQLEKQISELTSKKQQQRDQLRKVYQQLFNKVSYLKKFKVLFQLSITQQRQIQYKQTVSKLQQRLQYLTFSHNKDINKMKAVFQNKRQEIKQSTQKQIEHIQSFEVNKLRQKLSLQQQIKKQNQLMQEQIKLCEQKKQVVANQCKLLHEEIKKNLQEDAKTVLGGQATQTYERSLRVLKLQGKMNKLKQYLAEQTTRLDQQLKSIDKIYDQQQKLTNQKLQKLKSTISLKQRDYKKVKACSQMVLNQRSSLQAYLLQVFYENPQLSNKNAYNVNEILRKLFVKINSNKVPLSYKNYITLNHLAKSNASSSSTIKHQQGSLNSSIGML